MIAPPLLSFYEDAAFFVGLVSKSFSPLFLYLGRVPAVRGSEAFPVLVLTASKDKLLEKYRTIAY
jgi:hypothetical protein